MLSTNTYRDSTRMPRRKEKNDKKAPLFVWGSFLNEIIMGLYILRRSACVPVATSVRIKFLLSILYISSQSGAI